GPGSESALLGTAVDLWLAGGSAAGRPVGSALGRGFSSLRAQPAGSCEFGDHGYRRHGLSAGAGLSLPHRAGPLLGAPRWGPDSLVRRVRAGQGLRTGLWTALPLRGRVGAPPTPRRVPRANPERSLPFKSPRHPRGYRLYATPVVARVEQIPDPVRPVAPGP